MYIRVRYWNISVCHIALLIVMSSAQNNTDLTRRQVMTKLLTTTDYDASIVPDFDKEVPTNVTIQLIIHDIYSVSETAMEYSLDLFLRMWWRDERLDYSNYSTKPKLELDSKNVDNVWQPDVFFQNEKRASVHTVTTPNKLMHIHRNGTVVYSIRLAMTLGCTMKLQYYPFDRQRCPLYVQSYGYTRDNIDLKWDNVEPIQMSPTLEMPQFDLEEDIMTTDFTIDVAGMGTFSSLKVEMDLSRSVGFYFLQVFIPSVLLVFLSWLSFWVDPNAVPARVSLGVTCVLTMTTQSSGIRQSLPPVSYVKAIDVWMCACLMFVFAALLEFAYVNVLMRRPSKTSKIDIEDSNDVKVKSTTSARNDLSIEESPQETKRSNKTRFQRLKELCCLSVSDNRSKAAQIDCISRIAFPGTFVLFLLLFFALCFSSRAFSLH